MMTSASFDVAVIGGGPAGLAAAAAAARSGARVALVDMGMRPGGQYWMRETPHLRAHAGPQSRAGVAMTDAVQVLGVTIYSQAEVWAVFPGFKICATQPSGALDIAAKALVIAAGAHDRVLPFPGWTLPGVMTPGAGQRLVKLGATPPGDRIMLAGSGPFLLAVADTLRILDRAPVMLVEAQRPTRAVVRHLARFPGRWADSLRLLKTLGHVRARRFGWVVTEALGQDHVEAVRIAPIGVDGRIESAKSEIVPDIDCLLIGWGFQPSIELTALLGCRHAYDRAAGGWHCVVDRDSGQTSVPRVYVAGEITGIAGAVPAQLSGEIAGLSAAAALGFDTASTHHQAITMKRRRAQAFADGLNRLFQPPADLASLMRDDDLVVCRCEEVTRGAIIQALSAGTARVQGAKLWSRAGMGHCQGRVCGWAVAEIAAACSGGSVEEAGFNPPRIPVRPVALATVLAALANETLSDKTD